MYPLPKCKVKDRRKEQVLTNCEKEMIWCGILCFVPYVSTAGVKAVQ